MFTRRLQALVPLTMFASLGVYALWPWLPLSGQEAPPRTLVFYGFSIQAETMDHAVFPAFRTEWLAAGGAPVEFISSFAGSGTVANQVILGVPAQLALLSLELDAQRIAAQGVIAPGSWHRLPHRGVVNRTPFVILVRPGNPKGIRDFHDLTRPGIGVIHPDPMTSGGANWAIVAEYGAGMRAARDPEAGYALLLGIWRNVVGQASSARAARTQFEHGFGDALITYEQEALWDQAQHKLAAEIVHPRSTILSEHTLVVVDRNIAATDRQLVDAFTTFLWTEPAQRLFVGRGFRSVDERLNAENPKFHKIEDPFLIDELGGWEQARREIVEGVWKGRVLKELGR
jgi:sulfate/thiosulfate-binding protein